MYPRLILIHPINHQRTTPPHIINALIRQLLHARRLYNDIEPILIILLQLRPLRLGVLTVQLDVLVPALELLGEVHLDSLVGGDGDAGGAVEFEELSKDETSWAGAENEDFDTDGWSEFVEAMDGTGGGFEESGFFIGEVVNFVEFVLLAGG